MVRLAGKMMQQCLCDWRRSKDDVNGLALTLAAALGRLGSKAGRLSGFFVERHTARSPSEMKDQCHTGFALAKR